MSILMGCRSADILLVSDSPSPPAGTRVLIDGKFNSAFHSPPPHAILVSDLPSPSPSDQEPPPPVNGQLIGGGTGVNDDLLVIACGNCEARNLVETSKDSYYVVFKGKGGVGIYRTAVSSMSVAVMVP